MGVLTKECNPTKGRGRLTSSGGVAKSSVVMLGIMYLAWSSMRTFTEYDCNNQSKLVKTYSLLEPDPCFSSGAYGEIMQVKRQSHHCLQVPGDQNYHVHILWSLVLCWPD
jgi:hypothetical protein